jgi:hypothetical protein
MSGPNEFENELAIFQVEHETAQQYFFSYASLRELAATNSDVLRSMQETSLFWLTVERAMLLSTFIALGRIFDQNSHHNLDRLIAAATKQVAAFSRGALAARRRAAGMSADDADHFVRHAFEPSAADFTSLGDEIEKRRKIYNARYRKVRNKVFAHNEVVDPTEANTLLEGTTVNETKELFAFLDALDVTLWQSFHNGRKPTLEIKPFLLPSGRPGEKIYRQVNAILQRIVLGQNSA